MNSINSTSWKSSSRSASEESPCLLWKSKVLFPCQTSLSRIEQLASGPNPLLSPHFCNIHFNIIFQRTARSLHLPFPCRSFAQNFLWLAHLSHTCYLHCLFRLPCSITHTPTYIYIYNLARA